ncbi:MAG: hypothetical protein ACI4F9_10335 [Lachnospiraceae bacterium]
MNSLQQLETKVPKNLRILSIFTRLMEGKVLNKAYEANRFHVAERSIQRDVDDIRNFLAEERVNGTENRIIIYSKEHQGYVLSTVNGLMD